jgi:glycosyltransferase involved in cell wall biosynthesis
MVNSVHAAKWLAQFQDTEIDFYIFPSDYFMSLHPLLDDLLTSNSSATYSIQATASTRGLDYAQERVLGALFTFFSRRRRLARYINEVRPNIVHALEFQHAAYVCVEVIRDFGKNFEFIATNWGSDIFHFVKDPVHAISIREVLELADKYSAECQRDFDLAVQLGFKGTLLPIIPNSGGIPADELLAKRSTASSRRLIIVKGYGGLFGRVQIVLQILNEILPSFSQYSVFIYSVTNDVESLVKNLQLKYPERVEYSTLDYPLKFRDLQSKFSNSRVYVGCSISDGISTSFLESIVSGAYPIQTNTSCAQEWVQKGAVASLVNLDENEIRIAIADALENDDLVDNAQKCNAEVAFSNLEYENIKNKAKTFYVFK